MMALVAQRGGRCPISGDTQGLVGWGSERPGLVEDVPARCRGGQTGWPLKVPSNPEHSVIPRLCLQLNRGAVGAIAGGSGPCRSAITLGARSGTRLLLAKDLP